MERALYRGKRFDNEDWIIGYPFYILDDRYICLGTTNGIPNIFRVYKGTVGAYTGLRDKNGCDIFEGDIVKTEFGRLCEVVWFSSHSHCGWDLKYFDTPMNHKRTPPCEDTMFHQNNLEVVGNIHDGLFEPESTIGMVFFVNGHTEEILRLYNENGDISKKVYVFLNSFMFTTESGKYRFGRTIRSIGDELSVIYYAKPLFEEEINGVWYITEKIEKVELRK